MQKMNSKNTHPTISTKKVSLDFASQSYIVDIFG
jgi:hypothetical protein